MNISTTEIIAFSSGKGGTGKTLMAACLGYALTRSGHRVLMIDGDPGTDGLSLFLLGRHGSENIGEFEPSNTFSGILRSWALNEGDMTVNPRTVNRSSDHGVIYSVLISGRGLYGDVDQGGDGLAVPDLTQAEFRSCLAKLLVTVRDSGNYDYILIDTRGGFSFESTDVCALSDSFIVVTEPDYTSFYQDRNLVKRISVAADAIGRKPLLRAVIVNKATEGIPAEGTLDLDKIEHSFRLALEREFPIKYKETYPVPLDLDAVKSYKTQGIPYLLVPACPFSFATLSAFGDILRVVTAQWSAAQISNWNELVEAISEQIKIRNANEKKSHDEQAVVLLTLSDLSAQNQMLKEELERTKRELERQERQYEREIARTNILLGSDQSDQKTASHGSAPMKNEVRYRRFAAILISLVIIGGLFQWWFTSASQGAAMAKLYDSSASKEDRLSAFKRLLRTKKLFPGVDLSGEDLSGLDLRTADFRRANVANAVFRGCQLDQADFSGANLRGANLERASTNGTDFSGADLRESNLTSRQLGLAKADATTVLPSALTNGGSSDHNSSVVQSNVYIQIATVSQANADVLSEQLRTSGFAPIATPNPSDASRVRVVVGPVNQENVANTLVALSALGYKGMLVRKDLIPW